MAAIAIGSGIRRSQYPLRCDDAPLRSLLTGVGVSPMRAAALAFVLILMSQVAVHAQDPVVFDTTELAIVGATGQRHVFKVDWARTWAQKYRGLMFRKAMPIDHGMLLDYDPPEPSSIWMKNTLIPLDLIFIRADGVIESIFAGAKPHDETPRPSRGPVRAILEVNAGVVRLLSIREGDRVEHPIFPRP